MLGTVPSYDVEEPQQSGEMVSASPAVPPENSGFSKDEASREANFEKNTQPCYEEVTDVINDGGQDGKVWDDRALKQLLSLVGELWPKVGKTVKLKSRKKMWKQVEVGMNFAGYNFTKIQIENKYRHLARMYKANNSPNNECGGNCETCPYEKELGELVSGHPTIFPEYLVGAGSKQVLTNVDLVFSSIFTSNEEPQPELSCSRPKDVHDSSKDESRITDSSKLVKFTGLARRRRKNEEKMIREIRKLLRDEWRMCSALKTFIEMQDVELQIMQESNDVLRESNAKLRDLVNILKNE